jgi:hypothetical protein
VFLNVPYDDAFADLFLAYIVGLTACGLTPRATLEIPGGARRLDRIVQLIGECRYSIHDLSRVETDPAEPPTPRFNMPFELGLTVAWDRLLPDRYMWFVLESKRHRLVKSLSDLAGTDIYVHDATPEGVFRELGNAFVRLRKAPTVPQLQFNFALLKAALPDIVARSAARSIFEARAFKDLIVSASALADAPPA